MKIAIIGAGAMGSIYGAYLSRANEVCLLDKNAAVVDAIKEKGLILQEDGKDLVFRPEARLSSAEMAPVDLVILFVKALYSEAALAENRHLIGKDTYLLTLQNGSGHEDILQTVANSDHIIIGTTEDNGAVLAPGYVRHGGCGRTNIGMADGSMAAILDQLKENFDRCGFTTKIHQNIQQLIWDKLFTNISLSAVTGILQVPMGFIAEDSYAWELTRQLAEEALQTAKAMGLSFDEEEVLEKIRQTSLNNPQGCTSIYADLKNGRKTEVNTISGSVIKAASRYGVEVPAHRFLVNFVHAMENRDQHKK